jgi:hypothetical protein
MAQMLQRMLKGHIMHQRLGLTYDMKLEMERKARREHFQVDWVNFRSGGLPRLGRVLSMAPRYKVQIRMIRVY